MNQALMKLTTASMNLKDDQANIKNIELNEIVVRGGQLSYKSIKPVRSMILIVTVLFLYFFGPLLMGVLSHYISPLDHLDPTLVDHLNFHLSVCPIRHPLRFSVSCGSQENTVQGSSKHKCDQESSCSAFNAVVAAFPKIFPRSHHLWTFMIHNFIIGASWKVIMIFGICI